MTRSICFRTLGACFLLLGLLGRTAPVQAQDICIICDPIPLNPDNFAFPRFLPADPDDPSAELVIPLPDQTFDDPALGILNDHTLLNVGATRGRAVRFVLGVGIENGGGVVGVMESSIVTLVPGSPGLVERGSGPVSSPWEAFDDPALGLNAIWGTGGVAVENPEARFGQPEVFVLGNTGTRTVSEILEAIWGTGGVAREYGLILLALSDENDVFVGGSFWPFDLVSTQPQPDIPRVVEAAPLVDTVAPVALDGAYPNPFNPQTTIRYALSEAAPVRLAIYDLLGREVALLVDGTQAAGTHEAVFEATGLPSGVYLYRIAAGTFAQTGRMTLMK